MQWSFDLVAEQPSEAADKKQASANQHIKSSAVIPTTSAADEGDNIAD